MALFTLCIGAIYIDCSLFYKEKEKEHALAVRWQCVSNALAVP